MVNKSVMILGCKNIDDCGRRIGSQVLGPAQQYGAFSVIRRLEYLDYVGGGKNSLRYLRLYQARVGTIANGVGCGIWRVGTIESTWKSRCAESIAGGA